MAFLRINDENPSAKRPFRVSDIQDVWNGIKSLFTGIAGGQYRIISGFDVLPSRVAYTSGTVWYNGELYEYDSVTNPILIGVSHVYFYRIAQDERQLEGGDTIPFSYKYACGGTNKGTLIKDDTTFVANIDKYKSFIAPGSITSTEIAVEGVQNANLASSLRNVEIAGSEYPTFEGSTASVDLSTLVTMPGGTPVVPRLDVEAVDNTTLQLYFTGQPAIPVSDIYVPVNFITNGNGGLKIYGGGYGSVKPYLQIPAGLPSGEEILVMVHLRREDSARTPIYALVNATTF